jgi:predicted O-methyltransferase YrrM
MTPVMDEMVYLALFKGRLRDLGLPMIYRPFGAAANASMLFVTLRCIELHRPARVLDLGAGQSSLLLDALRDTFPMEIQTVEGDPGWCAAVGARVRHDVRLCPVETRRVEGHRVPAYVLPDEIRTGAFDLVLVDGPGGARRFGRAGALDVIAGAVNPGGVVLFDDTDRRGERETAALAEARLRAALGPIRRLVFQARSTQTLLAPADAPWLPAI